ncbi:MAG: polyprenyl synthetase family protein [Treponema sp.]|jgi:octaprenyl-diphosphate synthase|nr:polyprenyl synthetase family protein [Treponema sp.]
MNHEYTLRLEKIEAVLRKALPEEPDPAWTARTFLTPGDFTGGSLPPSPEAVAFLTEPGLDLFSRGGKRWRPLLMVLVCESLGGGDGALPLTPLVEFPHNASLIHDDIEDSSDERRGKPAVHLIYGTDTAVNGGCFLYFLPLTCVEPWDAPAEQKAALYALWGRYMRRLHLGQALDIRWHRDLSAFPEIEAYYTMCRLKTGCLAGLSAVLGVRAAFARKAAPRGSLEQRLGDAAEKLGVGFQILDDVRNLTTGVPGKTRGDDIVEGKKSLPVLLFLRGDRSRGAIVTRCFSAARARGTSAEEVEELISALRGAGVLEEAEAQGRALIRKASQVFSGIGELFPGLGGDPEARKLLGELGTLLAG